MNHQISLNEIFENYLRDERPQWILAFEDMLPLSSDYHSNWALESYCQLSITEQALKNWYLPQCLKQSIISRDVVYIPENPEDGYSEHEFHNFILANFSKKIPLDKLSSTFFQRLRFTSDFLRDVYETADKNKNNAINLYGIVNSLNAATSLPVLNITKEYLYNYCLKYIDSETPVEGQLYSFIMSSRVLKQIYYESDYEKKVIRYNSFLCSLILQDLDLTQCLEPRFYYHDAATASHIDKILSFNHGDFIKYNGALNSLIRDTNKTIPPPLKKVWSLQPQL